MHGDALRISKNICGLTRESSEVIQVVFRKKYVKPQSIATGKQKIHQLVFKPADKKLIDFLNKLHKLANNEFGVATRAIIEQFINAMMLQRLKNSINQAQLENGTYEQIVSHLDRDI